MPCKIKNKNFVYSCLELNITIHTKQSVGVIHCHIRKYDNIESVLPCQWMMNTVLYLGEDKDPLIKLIPAESNSACNLFFLFWRMDEFYLLLL